MNGRSQRQRSGLGIGLGAGIGAGLGLVLASLMTANLSLGLVFGDEHRGCGQTPCRVDNRFAIGGRLMPRPGRCERRTQ